MSESDSAEGQSPVPSAVIDRRSTGLRSSQLVGGSSTVSVSRVPQIRNQQNIQSGNIRISFPQVLRQINSNSLLNTSNNTNTVKVDSVVSSSTNDNSSFSYTTPNSDIIESFSPNKKIKLEDNSVNKEEFLLALKNRILEYKYQKLKSIREKYTEYVAELYFLQTGGNMMDYPVFRKKAHTPQFLNFMRSYKLDSNIEDISTSTSSPSTEASELPYGTEIKIPGVGVTPVAVSTQLPAAVAQLSQQGGTPLLLEPSSNKIEKNETDISLTLINLTNTNFEGNPSQSSGTGGQEQFSATARQEVYVMQRVTELQKEGLWTEKRLPKLQEPTRPKAHWDYLLEEMVWLAADFAQERKWKKSAAKKCARMVQKYFQDKAMAAQKAEKAQELHLKKIASFISKEIKYFWSNVEKLVEFKQHTKLEEKRKKALDQHLSFIVDQTEKFSQQLTEGMNKSVDVSRAPSYNSSRISSPKLKGSDDEFSPGNTVSDDDEETIAKAEAEEDEVMEEVEALKKESEMNLDDFLTALPKDYLQNRDNIVLSESDSEMSDDEFQATGESGDDENTIKEQEEVEGGQDHQKELDELNAENEMSIEDLLAKYKSESKEQHSESESLPAKRRSQTKQQKSDANSESDHESSRLSKADVNTDSEQSSKSESEDDEDSDMDVDETSSNESFDDKSEFELKDLMEDSERVDNHEKEDLINDAAAIAESIQPKGNTLSSTDVVTPIPFLLKNNLREYQHIGLDWLVTMHDRKLNGILADEMGLGKTIQTIALLAHLACVKGNWGPHLIIVPSSVMLNWEMEFKKWCPGFKILTYYGTQKERKLKRTGWTKPNTFHVCITSYKLVIQDQQSFRRKKWKYLILDEAQNIKNFKSQRWQLLLNFQSEQRLLLTGTPLQNSLMELWSLMHFLMPHVFTSHREFKEWFSNPVTGMIEGNSEYNESIIKRLHKVLRPFLLRRLKSEVEKQMPKKYEHVVMCRLSKRQRFLYDDFMSRAKTRETLASGNLLSVINVLMQLRKVCNHPNLFEVRPTISPFQMEQIYFETASMVCNIFDYDPFKHIDLNTVNLLLVQLEVCVTAYVAHRIKKLATTRKLIEEIDNQPDPPPTCPSGKVKLHVRIKDSNVHERILNHTGVKVGTSPAMKMDGTKFTSMVQTIRGQNKKLLVESPSNTLIISSNNPPPLTSTQQINLRKRNEINSARINVSSAGHVAQIVQTSSGRHILLTPTNSGTTVVTQGGQRLTVLKNITPNRLQQNIVGKPVIRNISLASQQTSVVAIPQPIATAIVQQWKSQTQSSTQNNVNQSVKPTESEFLLAEKEQLKKEKHSQKLKTIHYINQRRCDAAPIYGCDLRDSVNNIMYSHAKNSNWLSRSYCNCINTMCNKNVIGSLSELIKSIESRTEELTSLFDNFVVYVPAVAARLIKIHSSHPSSTKVNQNSDYENSLSKTISPKLGLLHPIISAMSTQFPDPRLIQYDCGKLQTLDKLLRKLKNGGHRVLIFTQMTKMLDILESFLNCHGHIYLRLDGTTKIEQRQLYMERFNGDKRVFVFILSTRSGGVGINLTGADTVIFYDSDWNPTMDAQAQDRCHRIGQTRDVHIYRLISEKTIEENILKKANQKRLLGDLAIEGGNFTTAYFKSNTIQDIFNVDTSEDDANRRMAEIIEQDKTQENSTEQQVILSDEKVAINAFESALEAAEDEQDVQATTIAKAEVAADLDEFDETIPIEEIDNKNEVKPELSKAEQEVENLIKQLSPIERYAMRFVEETGGHWTAEQLKQAEAEIELQKQEWEANRLAAIKKEEMQRNSEEANEILTYSSEDAKNQIWVSHNTLEKMPMWCPPTPPQDDNDVYKDYALSFLYDTQDIIPESQLPPVYMKKEFKRSRSEAGFFLDGRRPIKIRKEDNYYAPRSLFDKPSPALAKIRRELKLQRYRGNYKTTVQIPGLKQQPPIKPLIEPEGMTEWYIYEDMSILSVLQNLQGLPLNLMLLSPGHTPNWDLVSDILNQTSRTYRSPKQCRYRYESSIAPREEGKIIDSPKKQKKNKNTLKYPSSVKGVRSMRTAQLYINDNNNSFNKLVKSKFDHIKNAYLKKSPQLKQVLVNPALRNPKHAAVLSDFGIANYEVPITPSELVLRRAERLNKEKQKATIISGNEIVSCSTPQLPTHIHQTTIQVQGNTQQTTPVVIPAPVATHTPLLVQTTPLQVSRSTSGGGITSQQQSQQIVKALVASTSGNLQHIPGTQSNTSQIQITPHQSSQSGQTSTVPVVITTPATSLSTIQPTSQQQIVSIQTSNISAGNSIVTQAGTIVANASPQPLTQVVSVPQLSSVGTVVTTATLTSNVSSLRAQRIMAPGSIQEIVLNPRVTQSPTIVSVSGLGQGITQSQLQQATTQLRLQMGQAQNVSGIVSKGIPVGTVQTNVGKPTNAPQIQFYRQQTIRQQFKVLHTSAAQTGGTVLQTAGGQATLVSPGTIIQGGLVQQGSNIQAVQVQQPSGTQKVQLVSSASTSGAGNTIVGQSNIVGTVATVQVSPAQPRTQFIKHMGNKQTIARQVNDNEIQTALMIKRQIGIQGKAHVSQSQIQFAPAGVQVQQANTSGQIATLVKTSTGTATTLQQVKSGQIKTSMPTQTQVRQLQLQQQIAIAQQRKGGKMGQFAQITGKGIPTQLIVQNPKNLPGTVTVQQIQQVIRHAPPGTITTGQIVLGKPGRVIPVSVTTQPANRQTIQVVTAPTPGSQGLQASGSRTHVGGAQNVQGTIKVAASASTAQQQALLTAIQNQQRQNQNPVRLQTTGGSIVAVTVQQAPSHVVVSNTQPNSVQQDAVVQQQTTNLNPNPQITKRP